MVEETISLRQLQEEIAKLSIENIKVPVTREGKDLLLSRAALEALYCSDTTGRLHAAVDTSGRFTEASAANINTMVQSSYWADIASFPLTSADPSLTDVAVALKYHHRLAVVPITIAAGGAVTNVAIIAAGGAAKKAWFKVWGIEMDTTDATTTWFFHSTAGGTVCIGCPASPGFSPVALTAATVNTQLTGAYMTNNTANDITLLDVAGVGAGAANGFIYIEYWYE